MDKHSTYKGEAVLVIEQILNSPFMQELDIRTAFFCFRSYLCKDCCANDSRQQIR